MGGQDVADDMAAYPMVVNHVEEVVAEGIPGEPRMGHQWVFGDTQARQVLPVGLPGCSPRCSRMEVVHRHVREVRPAVRAGVSRAVEVGKTEDVACVLQIAPHEQQNRPPVAGRNRTRQLLEAGENGLP
eukprot:11228342-Lingulodinium_polyedra.AAC.3